MIRELKIGLFLGAGASVAFGKPTTQQLRSQLVEKYKYDDAAGTTPEQYFLFSIISFPKFEDIEHVLQCIKEVDDFFLNSQYGGKYLLEREYKLAFQDPRRPWEFKEFTNRTKAIRKMMEDDVFENYSWNHSADLALGQICEHLLNAVRKYSKEVNIFSTNYDRAIEEYCSNQERRCRCIDGFKYDEYSGRRRWTGSFSYPTEGGITNVYLYKLHGSLNWKMHKIYGIEATSEERRSSDSNYTENLLVYPTVSPKDGQEIEPYKTIRDGFKKFMESADACIVIGFSFRDEHINTIFKDFLKRGKSIIAISPSADKNVYENLLKRTVPDPEGTVPHKKDESIVCLFRENRKVITINQPLTLENADKVTGLASAAIDVLSTGETSTK